ncbi:MAG: hypothetical protein HC897_03630 [Thermoanaerobaculia bacterium]|nr:hypothetical protein [Thermoanaerobaculia bacterium]
MAHRSAWTWLALLALGVVCGCGRTAERAAEPPLETVEVTPGLEVTTEGDQQAKPRPVELTGVLPPGFPADLPIYLPSSVVDFGAAASGYRQVELLTPHPRDQVAAVLEQRLRQKGWTVASGEGARSNRKRLSKPGREAWLEVRDARPGTAFRYDYRPET